MAENIQSDLHVMYRMINISFIKKKKKKELKELSYL